VIVVLDASVILKWLLEDPARESDTGRAAAVIQSVVQGDLEILQPIHWLIEVAAVAACWTPKTAIQEVEMLAPMQLPTIDDPHVIRRATVLAIETGAHLFDTLYHAVALEHEDALLVTADDRYRRKAARYGKSASLRDWDSVA
jgi:predicted nucleic acid-binding protein